MNLKQETAIRTEPALNRILVGGDYRSFDRKFAELQTIKAGDLVSLGADGYWHLSTLAQIDAAKWQADHVYAVGAIVVPTTGNGHFYKATARSGDFKSHATTEPTWPTDGSAVVDDAVTWQDMGVFDTLAQDHGVALEDVTSAAGKLPVAPVFQAGAVKRSAVVGMPPTSKPVGATLGHLILC